MLTGASIRNDIREVETIDPRMLEVTRARHPDIFGLVDF
jgi:hypothetical protein